MSTHDEPALGWERWGGAGSAMLAAGAITSEEVAEVCAMCADPAVVDWSYQVFVAWGRRPVG